jgi:hypothetical protein
MTYKLNEKKDVFRVEETKPDQKEVLVVYETSDREKARSIYRGLKRGCGFGLWTPNFFIPSKEKVKIV